MKELRHLDLFAGGGGFSIAFQRANYNTVGAFDFDKFAVKSYKHNISDNIELADIQTLSYNDLPKANVWSGGFPCQDLSVGGKMAGMEVGTRSGLFYEIMRLLDETIEHAPENVPDALVFENVKGLRKYEETLHDQLKQRGYRVHMKLYNSKYWNVAQSRERYYVVCLRERFRDDYKLPREQLPVYRRLNSSLESDVDEKYFYNDDVSAPVRLAAETADLITEIDGLNMIGLLELYGKDQIRRVYGTNGVSPTLDTAQGGNRQAKVYVNGRVRKLVPREYFRLQGFPEDYEIVVSDTQAYKIAGNAVTVPLAQAVAESVRDFLMIEYNTK